ncbi:MAG: low molecular weight protein arginine phosphatase [Clostridiaceae bacterium]|nr:low molecular weight protein arginine phosphatase [Clostridiaceae bacterium]
MRICFVCTGNTCRSPMAEYLLRFFLFDCPKIEICSAGIQAFAGSAASNGSLEVMTSKYGIDLSEHRSTRIDNQLLAESDRIYAMTKQHKQILVQVYPEFMDKIETLGEAVGLPDVDVADPFGYDISEYESTADQLHYLLSRLASQLKHYCQNEDNLANNEK